MAKISKTHHITKNGKVKRNPKKKKSTISKQRMKELDELAQWVAGHYDGGPDQDVPLGQIWEDIDEDAEDLGMTLTDKEAQIVYDKALAKLDEIEVVAV